MQKDIPNVLWIAIISTGIMIGLKVAAAIVLGPKLLIQAVLTAVILYGIIRGYKWAFFITIAAIPWGIYRGFTMGNHIGVITLFSDCLVLVPMLLSWDYFFPQRGEFAWPFNANERRKERI